MKNVRNNKGFTLVELLAVIVVLAVVMGIAAVAITGVLDSTRKNAFVASAKQYIEGAKSLVKADMVEAMMGGTGKYITTCGTDSTFTIPLTDLKLETGGKSPYSGASYDNASSKVVVTASENCSTFSYKIFLTDGVYHIGTTDTPIAEDSISASSVVSGD